VFDVALIDGHRRQFEINFDMINDYNGIRAMSIPYIGTIIVAIVGVGESVG
jgi:hypothetical protein